MMWEACADKIEALGGRVALGRTLVSLAWLDEAGLWEARITRTDGEDEIVRARHVISSAPLREVAKIVSPAPFALPEIEKLRYRDFLIVALIGKTRAKLHDNWIYIHDPAVKVGRVQNFRSWSPEMIPDEETDCLGLEYFCFDGDGLWNSSDEDLIAQAKAEISRIGLMDLASVTDGCVIRQRKAYPVYDDGYRAIVDAARAEFSRRFPTFHFVGRNGMHKYNNQDHAMMTGLLTAENIIAGTNRYNVWTVNEDAEYSEAGIAGEKQTLTTERLVPIRVT